MSQEVAKIPRPQMRGLLRKQIARNLVLCGISVLAVGSYMKFIYGDGVKRKYAEFYKNYDSEKEFERMRKKGLFDSCDVD